MADFVKNMNLSTRLLGYEIIGSDYVVVFQVLDGTSVRAHKRWLVKGDGSGVHDLHTGRVILAVTPVQWLTDIQSLTTRTETAITNAATANRIDI